MSSANRGECVTTGGLYRHTYLCVAHFKLHKKVKVGKVGEGSMFWEVGGLYGVSERDRVI